MTLLLFTLCLLNLTGIAALAYAAHTAPDGFEDGDGFHRGQRPYDGTAQRELMFALSRV